MNAIRQGRPDSDMPTRPEQNEPDSTVLDDTKPSPPPGSTLPRRIGHYRLERIIASGRMSTVYEARDERLHRPVAFKVMKEGIGSRPAMKRFESEARILARLRHPGIAEVHDAGVHREGRALIPYFVMEYLPNARPITEHARLKHLTVPEKLELFAQVCDAVHHGHQQGVIHRDLKPANILVDSSGRPKIIDFGVARTTDPDLATIDAHGQLIGTPQYMSPEQVEPDPRDLDARSDVYALGLVLYKLLCGRLPYVVPEAPVHEERRVIRDEQPTRIATIDPALGGDIEMIVHKALEKERGHRYGSAEALAQDIRRSLRGDPVDARRASTLYVWRTRVRRAIANHRGAALVAAALVAAAATWFVGVPIIFVWTPANTLFERTVTTVFAAPAPGSTLENVRIIALTDETDVAALAEQEGLADVAWGNVKSLRRLHGRLMEKLAQSGARVVAWDITFMGETSFDEDFVRGARALREAGVNVVVAVRTWQLDERGLPLVSDRILPHVRWGGVSAWFDALDPWQLDLVVQKDLGDPIPSLALATLASFQHPDTEVSIALDPSAGTVVIRYWQRSPLAVQVRRMAAEPFHIALSDVTVDKGRTAEGGVRRGDLVGRYVFEMPDDDMLAAASIEYADIFGAPEEQLRRWFGGRAVVVGSARAGVDRYEHPDGRMIYGCYGHAAAIDGLLRSASVRRPRSWQIATLLLGAAAVGAVATLAAGGRPLRRYGLLAGLTVTALIGSALVYREAQYLCNPFVPVVSMLLAAELSSRIVKICAVRSR